MVKRLSIKIFIGSLNELSNKSFTPGSEKRTEYLEKDGRVRGLHRNRLAESEPNQLQSQLQAAPCYPMVRTLV